MANTTIALKKSGTASSVPSNLANGELAINYADGLLFYKHANGTIASIATGGGGNNFGTVNANGTLLVSDTAGDVLDIRAGDNIIITGDAVNDRLYINANLTAANSWANTKLANATGTLAGDLTVAGNITVTGATTYVSANSVTIGSTDCNSIVLITASATDQILDSFSNTIYHSAHYTVTMNAGSDWSMTQLSLVQNGTTSYVTEHGLVYTANVLASFTTNIVSGTVRLNVTPTFAATTIKMYRVATL